MRLSRLLLTIAVYFGVFAIGLAKWVPEYPLSVSARFAAQGWRIFGILGLLTLLGALIRRRRSAGPRETRRMGDAIHPGDVLLLLLPLTPIVQYVASNQDILSPAASVAISMAFAAIFALPCLLVPWATQRLGAARSTLHTGLAFTFVVAVMPFLSAYFHWYEQGRLLIQLAGLSAVGLVTLLVEKLAGRRFLYFAVSVAFVVNSAFQFSLDRKPAPPVATPDAENRLAAIIKGSAPTTTPNIYLLIYDAYVANETMAAYGIDNRAQEDYLVEQGFTLYPTTYSIERYTLGSMSLMLNASLDYHGNLRRGAAGDGIVANLLRGFGYTIAGVFWSDYFFRGQPNGYDEVFPVLQPPARTLAKSILMGEFRFDADFGQPSREDFLQRKHDVLAATPAAPRFLYVHDNLPGHSQNSGRCRPDEIPLFRERLLAANHEMRRNLDLILARDAGALIIVAGDHGPYLTKNCTATEGQYRSDEITRLDIQDRFGTFLAIRWPGGAPTHEDRITVLQDVFPAVMAYLLNSEAPLAARVPPTTIGLDATSGVIVDDGIIRGGADDGQPLFLNPARTE